MDTVKALTDKSRNPRESHGYQSAPESGSSERNRHQFANPERGKREPHIRI